MFMLYCIYIFFLFELGKFLFNLFNFSDLTVGVILLVVSLILLCGCLICLVKVLSSLLKGKGVWLNILCVYMQIHNAKYHIYV